MSIPELTIMCKYTQQNHNKSNTNFNNKWYLEILEIQISFSNNVYQDISKRKKTRRLSPKEAKMLRFCYQKINKS